MTTMVWHNDGHSLNLTLEKNAVVISGIECPFETNADAECQIDSLCVVKWFLERYGLECNVGVVPAAPVVKIAWTLVGNPNIGLDGCQVWTIPTDDEFFSAWLASQV
ncbi:MAG: hypothetical protein ACO3CH_00780 [Ilumatobacteraceae bacterium]